MTKIDAPLLLEAAASIAGPQRYVAGALYVVATPIGNLADLSFRAIHVLALVDAIACEDTRRTAALLTAFGIAKPLLAAHEHNEASAASAVVERLARGERVAYVSDAGTPALSDPGAALVAAVRNAGHPIVPIPGASSAVAALSVAGDALGAAVGGFELIGFLPARGTDRAAALERLAANVKTQIVLEAPHRIEALCASLGERLGARRVTLCRELTKQFEEIVSVPAVELSGWLVAEPNRSRGEFVVVVHATASDSHERDDESNDRTLETLLAQLPLKQSVAIAAELTGAPRNALYERALRLKDAKR